MDPSITHNGQAAKPIINPCTVDGNGYFSRFHLLSCGHIVAIVGANRKCARNCLHVTRSSHQFHSSILEQDSIGCEVCVGIPMTSVYKLTKDYTLRHALALTGHVITSWADHSSTGFGIAALCGPFASFTSTHLLSCNHRVDCGAFRSCAANCKPELQCPAKAYNDGNHCSDAIICQECVFRAELVYSRYQSVMEGVESEVCDPASSSTNSIATLRAPEDAPAVRLPQGSVTASNTNFAPAVTSNHAGAFWYGDLR